MISSALFIQIFFQFVPTDDSAQDLGSYPEKTLTLIVEIHGANGTHGVPSGRASCMQSATPSADDAAVRIGEGQSGGVARSDQGDRGCVCDVGAYSNLGETPTRGFPPVLAAGGRAEIPP